MATTFVEIANRAITFLGAATITALDDDTKEGRAIKRLYEQTRDQLLRDHPWNFAIMRVSIAANTTSPIYEYVNAFDWPADCLRVIEVETDEEWAVEARQIVTDAAAPLKIVYIHQVTDPNLFDSKFIEAYSLRLAADIAYDITASQTVAVRAENKFSQMMQQSRLIDAQESLPASELSWLDSRI
jgi:hypothetical protein